MVDRIHVVSCGARTPLGLNAAASAAAYRASISAAREHPFMIDRAGNPMLGALDAVLEPNLTGWKRLLALAVPALCEACASLSDRSRPHSPIPLFLSLPEHRPGFSADDVEAIRTNIGHEANLPFGFSDVSVLAQGHAAGLALMSTAASQMHQGAFETCIVGGVDSYFHPDTMEWLDENRQLAGAVSRSAFVPGEGAGFCLLMTETALARMNTDAMACLRSTAFGREAKVIKSDEICLGEGLTAAVERAVARAPRSASTIGTVICDINGERYRGEEWGFACLRIGHHFDDPAAYLSPADCWGDLGAASGPLFVMLACQAAIRKYATGSRSLLWASSEGGLRAAAVLDSATGRP